MGHLRLWDGSITHHLKKEYINNIYGDERGYAYTQNVKILSKIWVMK